MSKILITRPNMLNDEPTSHTFRWASTVINKARQNGHEIIDYKKGAAEYNKFNNAMKFYDPDVYIHFGHGCPSSLIGQKSCMITNGNTINDYENLQYEDFNCSPDCDLIPNVKSFKDKIVIAYSCHSSARLGVCAMKHGAKAYIGFNDYLIFMIDTVKSEELFTQPILEFTNALLEGDTLSIAKLKTDMLFDENIKNNKNVKYLARFLLWDKMAFTVYGNPELTIYG